MYRTLLLIIGLSGSHATYAYMSPTEVFPDLEVSGETNDSEYEEAQAAGSVNPFDSNEAISEQSSSASSSSTQSNAGIPIFYRSGEELKPTQETTSSQTTQPTNVFEEVSSSSSEESISSEPEVITEPEAPAEEEVTEPEPEEPLQEAAPGGSMLMGLMGQMKYIIGAVGLAAAGVILLFMKKKKPAVATGEIPLPGTNNTSSAATPEPQIVEESSERLQHALDSISTDSPPAADSPVAPPEK